MLWVGHRSAASVSYHLWKHHPAWTEGVEVILSGVSLMQPRAEALLLKDFILCSSEPLDNAVLTIQIGLLKM